MSLLKEKLKNVPFKNTKQIKIYTWSKLRFKTYIHHHKHIGSSEQVLVLQGSPHSTQEQWVSAWQNSPLHESLDRELHSASSRSSEPEAEVHEVKSRLLQPSARFPQRHLWSIASYSRPIESRRQMWLFSFYFLFFYLNFHCQCGKMFTHTSSASLFGFLLSVLEFLHNFALVSTGVRSVRVATRLLLRPALASSALCS